MRQTIVVLILTGAAAAAGCDRMEMWSPSRSYGPAPAAAPVAAPAAPVERQPAYAARPVAAPAAGGPGESAVDTALAWAQKHADVSAKLSTAERENRTLAEKNQVLQMQLDASKQQLAAAQKELGEANAMMKELEGRLAKWQENVLGYRQEMREAQKVQMEALARVIKLLGGEVAATPAAAPSALPGREVRHVAP